MSALEAGIGERLKTATGCRAPARLGPVCAGGGLNQTAVLVQGNSSYFVKLNTADRIDMFAAERDGLFELAASATLRVPQPICLGTHDHFAFLVLEYLELRESGDSAALGSGLAAMHRVESDRFGWHRDNTIGLTPQRNDREHEWVRFWQAHRLGFQLELAHRNGYGAVLDGPGGRLLEGLHDLLQDHEPVPSLLHGDLWRGNAAFLPSGEPVIYDPAVYFGDREADLAMCELFGGFDASFHSAYRDRLPLPHGYDVRRNLYQLYHVLNHLNLFGGAYLAQAEKLVGKLLSELR